MKGENIDVQGIAAYQVASTAGPSRGAVLLIHEWWGLNEVTRTWADAIAALGYDAVAADLFDGKVTADPAVAARYMEAADPKVCLAKLGTVLSWMKAKGGMNAAKVATIGWCFGGGLSLQCALEYGDKLVGSVLYYGKLETDVERLRRCKTPLLGIFAKKDSWITLSSVNQFEHACRKAAIPHEVHVYDADHAFANPTHKNHNPALAVEAWRQVEGFFKRVLG